MARQVRGRKARQKGFSLIEIMVVVVIIGILAVTVTTSLVANKRSKAAATDDEPVGTH